MIVIWVKFAKVWTNFKNLIENFKSISENFNKNLEKFNENLKFFLLLIIIFSALKNLCLGGTIPWPPSGAVTDYSVIIYTVAESQEVEFRSLANDITIRQDFRNISCLLILLVTS